MDLSPLESEHLKYRVIESDVIDGHNVARADSIYSRDDYQNQTWYFVCDCDIAREKDDAIDPSKCKYRKKYQEQLTKKVQEHYHRYWQRIGLSRAIMHIFRRVNLGEFMGQHHQSMIYVQEVAHILELTDHQVLLACGELMREKKIDLNGMILTDWQPPQAHLPEQDPDSITNMESAIETLMAEGFDVFYNGQSWYYRRFVPVGTRERSFQIDQAELSIPLPLWQPIIIVHADNLIELARKVLAGEEE